MKRGAESERKKTSMFNRALRSFALAADAWRALHAGPMPPPASTRRLSRRQFLRRGAAAAGAVAFPTFVPASALGRGGAVPPSERITMGFIGVGGQGGGHLFGGAWTYVAGGFLGRADVQVLAVCDVRRSRRDPARERVDEIGRAHV